MSTVAQINRIASTNRKRLRASDEHTATPQKRQMLSKDALSQPSSDPRPSVRKSISRLKSRTSLPITTPARRPQNGNIYDPQESPKGQRENSELNTRSSKKKGVIKKKRLLNRKGDKKVIESHGFDKRRQSTIDPSSIAGVTLTTADSPAKNTRARRELPLKKLHPDYIRPIALDAESSETVRSESRASEQSNSPSASRKPHERQYRDDSESSTTGGITNIARVDASGDTSQNQDVHELVDCLNGEKEAEAATTSIRANEVVNDTNDQVGKLTSQSRNYMRRQYEEYKRNEKESEKRGKQVDGETTINSTAAIDSRGSTSDQREQSDANHPLEEESDEDRRSEENQREITDDTPIPEAQNKSKERKGRPKMSEEQKQARKEAEARKRQENAKETKEADIQAFNAKGREFVRGIADAAIRVGGLEAWSKLGAGARTISSESALKREMDTPRAEVIWIKLGKLKDIFLGEEDATEDRINHLISSLEAKSTWAVLTRNGEIKGGDPTIINLFEHIIPQSVEVLQATLKERFVAAHKVSWQELLKVAGIAMNLCEVAMEWRPKPSTLVPSIRQEVRRHIQPTLVSIHTVIKNKLDQMELIEKRMREAAAFTRFQQMKREEKRRAWEEINRESPHQLPRPTSYVFCGDSDESQSKGDGELERNDSFFVSDGEHTQPSDQQTSPRPILQRQITEEIPAPDPNTSWSEKENVALLNGLQKFLGIDRYNRILEDPHFAKVLSEKDVDQCMARARFYKAGCGQILKEMEERGDGSFNWLKAV